MTSEPDQIRGDIQQTQRELSADVDALTENSAPADRTTAGAAYPHGNDKREGQDHGKHG